MPATAKPLAGGFAASAGTQRCLAQSTAPCSPLLSPWGGGRARGNGSSHPSFGLHRGRAPVQARAGADRGATTWAQTRTTSTRHASQGGSGARAYEP
uniref:Uncharacterized protein n=1 Tax=Cafeteria roenbergensis TaxID=33653 RepID=A0A7S0K4I6_CAFRO